LNIKNNNILVTGGAGYIGSHTCMLLHKKGYNPIVIDNLSTGRENAVKWGPFYKGNIGDKKLIIDVINRYNPIAVIHFAAFSEVLESILEPVKYFQNNVVESLKFFDALIEMNISNLIFSSSCAVYGAPENIPIDEYTIRKPINPYGESKLIIEKVLRWHGQLKDFNWISLRYFNVAGASVEHSIGENIENSSRLIPRTIKAASGYGPKLEIYGNDFDTDDGTAIRDYINVMDIADAHILALNGVLNNSVKNDCYNVGNAIGTSVMEILDNVKKICGKDVPFKFLPRKKGEPAILLASTKKFQNFFSWEPKHNLEETIQSTFDWVENWFNNK
jgi:UDP-glucose-4-epimerase GalE